MDQVMPFLGAFSVLFFMLFGALWLGWMILWILVPFTLFAIRKQVDEQTLIAHRVEKRITELLLVARAQRGDTPNAEPPAPTSPGQT
jgi:hypothetical protein